MKWFDTHAHLCDPKFDADRTEVIERAFSNSVEAIVEIADGPDEWAKARVLSENYNGKILWAAGIHPYFSDRVVENTWEDLQGLANHPNFVAVGEIGLDYAKCPIPREVQQRTFTKALEVSSVVNKPLIVHCRNAFSDLLPILRSFFSKHPISPKFSPGVIHCFSGTATEAKELLSLGFYLGVDGPLTYPNSHSLREALEECPLEKLVLETDSPYLPPQKYRGQRNEPGYLPLIGTKLAELRELTTENTANVLSNNAKTLFRLKLIEK